MTEAFIESAMMALTGAWNNDTVVMSCQPLSEALQTVATLLTAVRGDLRGLHDTTGHMRVTVDKLEDDSLNIRARMTDMESKIALLTTDTHGFVQRPEMLDRLSLLKQDAVAAARADHDRAMAQLDSMHTQLHETIAHTQRNRENHEAFKTAAEDQLASVRVATGTNEENWRTRHEDHKRVLDGLGRSLKEYQVNMQHQQAQHQEDLDKRFERTIDKAAAELSQHSEDTLVHLKEQAEEIAQLRRQLADRIEATPSRTEVADLVKSMESSRLSVDEAQYRLSETFSQCMAMLGSSATGGVGGGNSSSAMAGLLGSSGGSGGGGGGGNNNTYTTNTSMGYNPNSPTAAKKHSTSSAAERVLASLRPSAGAANLLGSVPVGMEVQLETLRQDVRSIQDDVLPRCLDQIKGLSHDVDLVHGAVTRGESLAGSLVECLSLGDGDELRASLLARDHHKTIVLLRRAFNVLASSKFTLGGSGGNAASPKKGAGSSSSHSIAIGGDDEPKRPKMRDGATTSADADDADPVGSTTFVPPSAWDRNTGSHGGGGGGGGEGETSEEDAVINSILKQYRAPPLGLDLADAVGGTLGANVMLVNRDSIAGAHGVGPGDRIIKVNGERCDNCSAFVRLLTIAVRRAVINHHAKGLPASSAPALLLDLTVIPSRGHATRHVSVRARLQVRNASD